MTATISLFFVGCAFSVLFLGFLWAATSPKVWRGDSALDPAAPPAWWPFSVPLWAGVARSFVSLAPVFILVFAFVGAADLLGVHTNAGSVLTAVGGAVFFAAIPVYAGIILFNRPKALVPPPWRGQLGARAEWRGARARNRPG